MVALGNGDGTFRTPVDYGYPGFQIQAIDVNGDGKLDLVTDGICTLLGIGDGTFAQAGCTESGASGNDSMIIGDLNGDGKPDVALWDQAYGRAPAVAVYPGRGDGTFGSATTFALPNTNGFYAGLSFGDFNGDGRVDLVVGGIGFERTHPAVFLQTVAEVEPTSLAFGNQHIGKKSPPLTVTFTNDKPKTLIVKNIEITGTDDNAFKQHNNCGTSLPAHGSCHIRVTFTPKSLGAKSASVKVAYEGTGGPQTVPLSGTGTH
jgi:hypothetical protein